MDENSSFRRLLDQYRESYVLFITTGSQSHKDAFERIRREITKLIETKQSQFQNEKSSMSHFMKNYKKDQDVISGLFSGSESLFKSIGTVKDKYKESKEQYDQLVGGDIIEPPVVVQPKPVAGIELGYDIILRLGILILVIILFFFAAYYFQGGTLSPEQQTQQLVQNVSAAITSVLTPKPAGFGMTPGTPYIRR